MNHNLFVNRTIFVASLALFPLMLPVMSSATEAEDRARAFSEKQEVGLKRIAVESAQDTLKACLRRIPLDASAGQLMLAEQNCQQAEVARKEIRLTF